MILEELKISATFKIEDGSVHTEVFNPHWANTKYMQLSELPEIIIEDVLDTIVKKHRVEYPENVKISITFGVDDFIDEDLDPPDKYNLSH